MSNDGDADDLDPPDAGADPLRKDQDGARSMRDLQEESGDEDEVDDVYAMDRRSAHDAGVDLDRSDGPEAPLN